MITGRDKTQEMQAKIDGTVDVHLTKRIRLKGHPKESFLRKNHLHDDSLTIFFFLCVKAVRSNQCSANQFRKIEQLA